MHPHIGAAGHGALDLIASLQALTSPLNSSGGAGQGASPFGFAIDPSAGASASAPGAGTGPGASGMTPDTMNALFAAQSQTPAPAGSPGLMSQLFSLLDTNNDGAISKSEFEAALGQNGQTTQADSVFAKLDANADGSVSPGELANALQDPSGKVHHHHHHPHDGGDEASSADGASSAGAASAGRQAGAGGGADDLLGAGNTGQTVTNADGSTTTTLSYADGSQVTMTMPAAGSSGSGAAPNNFLERMIQRQAQMLASWTAGQSVAMSV
jgi:hypothetical protein